MASYLSGLRPHHLQEAINSYADGNGDEVTLSQALAVSVSQRDAERPYACPKCAKKGEYPLSKETGIDSDTQKVTCDLCDGWGATKTQATPRICDYDLAPEETP